MNLNELLNKYDVEAFWVTNHYNKRYLSNFSGTTCEVVVVKDKTYFITDGRYQTQVKTEVKDCEVIITNTSVSYNVSLKEIFSKFTRIGFEANHLTVAQLKTMEELCPDNEFVAIDRAFEQVRRVKTADEIDKIKKAVAITDKAFSFAIENIKPGMTEREAQVMIDSQHMLLGADGLSFDTILVSGTNTARPHGQPSDKVIESGDIVTLDFGCYKDGYVSDMTRTFFVGKVGDQKLAEIHDLVLKAANAQIVAVKPGVKNIEIDKIARDIFKEADMDQYFIHGTGHGIGLEIHEEPYVNLTDPSVLEVGHAITIEPGLYVEGLGGVRIEQDVIVTEDGCIELNQSDKSYLAAIK